MFSKCIVCSFKHFRRTYHAIFSRPTVITSVFVCFRGAHFAVLLSNFVNTNVFVFRRAYAAMLLMDTFYWDFFKIAHFGNNTQKISIFVNFVGLLSHRFVSLVYRHTIFFYLSKKYDKSYERASRANALSEAAG